MNADLQHIQQSLQKQESVLASRYHVRRLGVFGSVARGDQGPASDVDILVELAEPIGLFGFVALEEDLKRLLGRNVDLVTTNALHPLFKQDILRETVYV